MPLKEKDLSAEPKQRKKNLIYHTKGWLPSIQENWTPELEAIAKKWYERGRISSDSDSDESEKDVSDESE